MIKQDDTEEAVLDSVTSKLKTGDVTHTALRTDNRVITRITDGIYRSPTSAIRELVANAYDADATTVTIEMNPPWFDRIVVRDDGNGMDAAALVHLIQHIGGSSKRTLAGRQFNTTGSDPLHSPKGRRLIGRIGIGLFSVAQMTRHFQIVTKPEGADYRIFADIILDNYNEDVLATQKGTSDGKFSTGKVSIQTLPTDDLASHGTDVILLDIKREALGLLTSREDREAGKSFAYHVGVAASDAEYEVAEPPVLPWEATDEPLERFKKLYQQVSSWSGKEKSKIENILDRYLQMIWRLALSVPLQYLDGTHPFDLDDRAEPRIFRLSNEPSGTPSEIQLQPGERVRDVLQLKAPESGGLPFRVLLDGVELRRPVRFTGLYDGSRPLDRPLLFVGSWKPPLDRFPSTTSGGRELDIEGYFLWMPRVIPAEHRGVLVRIADASGILYDERFMDYPIAELTRLAQTTAELFIHRGLDAALNIDRESFNFGHPHAKLVRHWVHGAERQLVATQKRIAEDALKARRTSQLDKELGGVERVVKGKLEKMGAAEPPAVELAAFEPLRLELERRRGTLAYQRDVVLENVKRPRGKAAPQAKALRERQLRAIARLLEAFGAFEKMDFHKQQELLNGIAQIVWGTDE